MVSPILRLGSPAGQRTTWTSVALVIAIVRRHGGTGSYRTSGHFHNGVGGFGRDPALLGRHYDSTAPPPARRRSAGCWACSPPAPAWPARRSGACGS